MANDLVTNRKARFQYHLLDTWEAGVALLGSEVKSLREGQGQLQDAYVDHIRGELWLRQCHIAPWTSASWTNHDPLRDRKLLLKKSEILKIAKHIERKGLTLIPLSIYVNDRGKIKIQIALAEGKQAPDKKAALKARQAKREMDRIRKGDRD
ncbi:MAG: SsrA-binding protein SmpB [Holophagaceae bacterium]|jgi:SsrA-binding protein|nr:SsrA-binding protein [Acidobacteriota bacterium]